MNVNHEFKKLIEENKINRVVLHSKYGKFGGYENTVLTYKAGYTNTNFKKVKETEKRY